MPLRLDPVVTATYVVTLCAPVAAYVSIRLARLRDHERHRRAPGPVLVQRARARAEDPARRRVGGVRRARPPALVETAHRLLGVHIVVAVATYLLWTWLVVASWRRYQAILPGRFSCGHRRLGAVVFGGLCFTAASASGMFTMAFVL